MVQAQGAVVARGQRDRLAVHGVGGDVALRRRRREQDEVAVAPVGEPQVVVRQQAVEACRTRDDVVLAIDDRREVDTRARLPEEADGGNRPG